MLLSCNNEQINKTNSNLQLKNLNQTCKLNKYVK